MISRSISKTINKDKNLRDFKIKLFKKIEKLTEKINNITLKEKDIEKVIDELKDEFGISYGQAQKPINVILKYHYYLTNNQDPNIKKSLHCPIDSLILKELNKTNLCLSRINKRLYYKLQEEIQEKSETRIEFDDHWDVTLLKNKGLI